MDVVVYHRHSAHLPEMGASLDTNMSLDHRFEHWTSKFEIAIIFYFLILFLFSFSFNSLAAF